MSTPEELQAHQIAALLGFLSSELGRPVLEADIHDDQHDPDKLRFNVVFDDGPEVSAVEVDYAKLRDHMTGAQATYSRGAEMPGDSKPVPPQFSRAVTLVAGERSKENARKVIAILSEIDFQTETFPDQAQFAVAALGLNLRVTHGPPANVGKDLWVTQLAVRSEDQSDAEAGCSFQFGAMSDTDTGALALLFEGVSGTVV